MEPRFRRVPATGIPGAWLIFTGFYTAAGDEITFYESMPDGTKTPVLNDACSFLKLAGQVGVVLKVAMLQQLAHSYKVKLSEENALFDDGTEPIEERYSRFMQCLVALEGILRMWALSAPARVPIAERTKDGESE